MSSPVSTAVTSSPTAARAPVLVAVGADHWRAAVREGAAAALRLRTGLHLLCVVDLTAGAGPDDRPGQSPARRGAETLLWEAVVLARALVGDATPVSSEMAHGEVVGRILAAGRSSAVAVLQRHPATAPGSGQLDVCARVAALATLPVLCVPDGWEPSHGRTRGVVTVGVDEPLTCGPLLREAVAAAAARSARLVVAHARPDHAGGDDLEAVGVLERQVAQARQVVGSPVPVLVRVLPGDAAAVLLDASRLCTLLVVGRHHPHRTGASTLGRVARTVVRRAACPVLLPVPSHSVASGEWVFRTRWA